MEKTLAKRELLEYLGKVKELEVSCYQQEIIVDGLKNELNQLLADQKYWSNQLSQSAPQKPGLSIGSLLLHLLLLPLSLVVGCIVGYILFYGVCLILFIPSLFFKPLNEFTNHIAVGCVLLCAIICAGVVIVSLIREIKNPKQEYQADKVKYVEAQHTAESQIGILNQRVSTLKAAVHQADNKLKETENRRQSVYDMGYIYDSDKYRKLIPVCTMLEYLESGRCDTLTGPFGAYNKYDNELLNRIIIGELHEINRHLDQIECNQRILADAIRQSERTINRVIGSVQNTLGGIQECVAYSAYYDKVTATNTAYLAWMRTFNK